MREKKIGNVLKGLRCEQGYSIDEVSAVSLPKGIN